MIRSVPAPLIGFLFALLCASCYPAKQPAVISKADLVAGTNMTVPAKIHLIDGSVIVTESGFVFRNDTLLARGTRYNFWRAPGRRIDWVIPVDSLSGLEYFNETWPGARPAASLLLGASIAADAAAAAAGLLVAIFGSCPTVYSVDSAGEHLEAECFSYSIGKELEMADCDRLSRLPAAGGQVTMMLRNEALETHYIDRFAIGYVEHPAGTEVFPNDDNELLTVRTPVSPLAAVSSDGKDILPAVRERDTIAYTCDSAGAARMFALRRHDWIDCRVALPHGTTSLTIAIRARNTLQNTTLLYDVMMRNQGLNVLRWMEDVNENLWYSWRLSRWYKDFAGIEVLVNEQGDHTSQGRFFDAGPIAWRQTALNLPLSGEKDTVSVRLSFLPDNWMIDWIGFSAGAPETPSLSIVPCTDAVDEHGATRTDAVTAMERADNSYLITYPGEWLRLTFNVPPGNHPDAQERTFFALSKGYYVEWVRPEWVKIRDDVPGFDITQREEIAQQLSKLWLSQKRSMERDFFEKRVPSWPSGGGQ